MCECSFSHPANPHDAPSDARRSVKIRICFIKQRNCFIRKARSLEGIGIGFNARRAQLGERVPALALLIGKRLGPVGLFNVPQRVLDFFGVFGWWGMSAHSG